MKKFKFQNWNGYHKNMKLALEGKFLAIETIRQCQRKGCRQIQYCRQYTDLQSNFHSANYNSFIRRRNNFE